MRGELSDETIRFLYQQYQGRIRDQEEWSQKVSAGVMAAVAGVTLLVVRGRRLGESPTVLTGAVPISWPV